MGNSSRDGDIVDFDAVLQSDGSYIDHDGDISWYNEIGEWHREDGPAIISINGDVEWWYNDTQYTSDVEWWYNDTQYTFDGWCIVLNKTDEEKMLLRLRYD